MDFDFEDITNELIDESKNDLLKEVTEWCEDLDISDTDNQRKAEHILNFALISREYKNMVDSERINLVSPLLRTQKEINSSYKSVIAKLQEVEDKAHVILDDWIQKQREIDPYLKKISTDKGSFYKKKDYYSRTQDISLVPLEYLKVDHDKVKEAIKEGVRNIPGIEIYEVEINQFRLNGTKE